MEMHFYSPSSVTDIIFGFCVHFPVEYEYDINFFTQKMSYSSMDSISVAHSHLTTLVLRFLEHHRYFNAMRALELETGKRADTSYGADLEFFRDLLLDGAWADAEDFIEPLEAHDEFN